MSPMHDTSGLPSRPFAAPTPPPFLAGHCSMRRLILRLAAATVLAASALVAVAPPAQAQSECAEFEQEVRRLTREIQQSPTEVSLRDQRRIAQARLSDCETGGGGDSAALANTISECRELARELGDLNACLKTSVYSPPQFVSCASPCGGDEDAGAANYDSALEQAKQLLDVDVEVDSGGGYSAGFRVTQQITSRDVDDHGTTFQHCAIVMRRVVYDSNPNTVTNPGKNPESTWMPELGLYRNEFTDVAPC